MSGIVEAVNEFIYIYIWALTQKRTSKNEQAHNNQRKVIVFYDGVCYLPFYNSEDESLKAIRW